MFPKSSAEILAAAKPAPLKQIRKAKVNHNLPFSQYLSIIPNTPSALEELTACLAWFVNGVVTVRWFDGALSVSYYHCKTLSQVLWTASTPLPLAKPYNVISVTEPITSVGLPTTDAHVKPRRLRHFRSRSASTGQQGSLERGEVSPIRTFCSILSFTVAV